MESQNDARIMTAHDSSRQLKTLNKIPILNVPHAYIYRKYHVFYLGFLFQ